MSRGLQPPSVLSELAWAWRRNAKLGWPERLRGLHYWLGFEYALILSRLEAQPGSTWLDVGSGAHSVLPVLLADRFGVDVVAVDVDSAVAEQRRRQQRARRARVGADGYVHAVQADARALPFADETFDGFTAVSSLEHVAGVHGDRQALCEAARILKPGGVGYLTVPFRAAGSMHELDPATLKPFQWHYSSATMDRSLITPAGLEVRERVLYGERFAFYDLSRRLPWLLDLVRRPVDTVLTAALLHVTDDAASASGVLNVLRKPPKPLSRGC